MPLKSKAAVALLIVALAASVTSAYAWVRLRPIVDGADEAVIYLQPLDPAPPVAYAVTPADIARFPLLGTVLHAYGHTGCCPEARMEGETLLFTVPEVEALDLHDYLINSYEALDPPPALYTVALLYEGAYYQFEVGVP